MPERRLTRTGVPSFLLKTPKYGKNAPSYEATAWIRSAPIIHTAPDVIEGEDEAERHHDQQHVRGAAVDAVKPQLDRVDEPAETGDLARREHEHDPEDRDRRT